MARPTRKSTRAKALRKVGTKKFSADTVESSSDDYADSNEDTDDEADEDFEEPSRTLARLFRFSQDGTSVKAKRRKGNPGARPPVYTGEPQTSLWRREREARERAESMQGSKRLTDFFVSILYNGKLTE